MVNKLELNQSQALSNWKFQRVRSYQQGTRQARVTQMETLRSMKEFYSEVNQKEMSQVAKMFTAANMMI